MKLSLALIALSLTACIANANGTSSFKRCPGNSLAHDTFNAFWSTLDTDYAVFDVRLDANKTWAAIGKAACANVSATMSDTALFDLLIGMAKNLDDGHTTLYSSKLDRDEDAATKTYPNEDAFQSLEDLIETNYLDGDYTTAAEDEISWGTIANGTVGFISITSMESLSTSGDEDDDVAAANAAMKAALAALDGTEAIIVDVRANDGGWDTVSLEIAAWFAGPRTVAWSEQLRNGPAHTDFAAPVPTFVDATRTGGFAGPVILLTSTDTFSAAETFALAMRVRSNVILLGERSSGHLSDMIDAELPNGWELTYSGERYIAADGNLYETTGVPVDVPIPFDAAALANKRDNMLEAALAHLDDAN